LTGKPEPAGAWRLPERGGVREIETTFVTVGDGTRLALQLWIPADAARHPAPVVLESIPYRKRDRYRAYGQYWGRTLAGYGVAYARLDVRGSGDSGGVLADEYLPSEQQDGAEVIAWLAAQPWCNGAVGVRGVSWGGFSALQTAALRPPALKAIMPMCASDRRFTDDAHYVGGAFALTGLKWTTSFKIVAAAPPDPAIVGEAWAEMWAARLEATPPIAARWLSHQSEDAYWRQGSLAFDPAAIACPVYLVGGLADPYNAIFARLPPKLTVPWKGLIGPWTHGYPAPASPGPSLDWAFEEVRWWREHLAGEATGIMDEPRLRVFMPNATAAAVSPGPIPGRWIAEDAFPAASVERQDYHLAGGALALEGGEGPAIDVRDSRVVGLRSFEWVPFAPPELPSEQSADDARSVIFDTAPLTEPVEILGRPALRVTISSDRPAAHLAARLCDVSADGRSHLVSFGVLNLAHRGGHDRPSPLTPGQTYEVTIDLAFAAHRFEPGHRLRLALSSSLWPLVWPAPEIATLSLSPAGARLELPGRAPPTAEAPMPIPLAAPTAPDPARWPTVEIGETPDGHVRLKERWPVSEAVVGDVGVALSGSGPNVVLEMSAGDPLSCVWRAEQTSAYRWADRAVELRAEVEITAETTHFRVRERLVARLDGEAYREIPHETDVPRG